MIFRASALCNDFADTFLMRKTAKAAHPADFKQGPAQIRHEPDLYCLSEPDLPWNPSQGQRIGFARAGNKALIYNI